MIELDIECTPATASLDIKRVERLCTTLDNKPKLMADVRKHLRLQPPESPRVKLPTISDRFTHTRNVRKSTQRFFTTGNNVPAQCRRDVLSEPNPFSANKGQDILHKVFLHSENKNQPPEACLVQKFCSSPCVCKRAIAGEKKSCNSAQRTKSVVNLERKTKNSDVTCPGVNPILARLYVPNSPIPPSKTEVDPNYFTTVRGRPVREKFNIHEFSKTQKTVFFKKLFAGFFKDEVEKRQEQYLLDVWELNNINRELDKVKNTLEVFENESHSESVKYVTEQMVVSKIREEKENELRRCKGFVNAIKASLYKKDDILSTSMYCRDILLALSPTKFRLDYEEEVRKHRTKTKKLVDKVITLFADYCRYNPDSEPDLFLNEVVHTFVKQLLSLGPPKIYFTRNWELDLVFRKRELQCMDQMADLRRVERMQKEIDDIARDVKKYYSNQIAVVKQEIDASRANSQYEHKRAEELEGDANLVLNSSFKDIVAGDITLETNALVEVLYTYILGPSNAHFDAPEMMLQIEDELRNVEIKIQAIGEERYRVYEKKVEKRMKKEIADALEAQTKDRTARAGVLRAKNLFTGPPVGPGWRKPMRRSAPIVNKTKQIKVDVREEKKQAKHLQLEGICSRDDVETELNELLAKFAIHQDRPRRAPKGQSEDSRLNFEEDLISLPTTVSSQSMERAILPFYNEPEEEVDSERSLSLIQLDYDSEEELLRKNFERRKKRGEELSEPDVLYDIRDVDSLFMVTGRTPARKTTKDKRHDHRPPPPQRTNPLSWR